MIMLDATKSVTQKELLEAELEAVGIRLNTQRPNVYFKVREEHHRHNGPCSMMDEEGLSSTKQYLIDTFIDPMYIFYSYYRTSTIDQDWRRNQFQRHMQAHYLDGKNGLPYPSRLQYVPLWQKANMTFGDEKTGI